MSPSAGTVAVSLPAISVAQILRDLGYLGLAALMFAETLFPPIPSEAVLPLAGYLVERGELAFGLALAASTFGSVTSSIVLYEMARRGGRPFTRRFLRLVRIGEEDLDRAEAWFERRGPLVVLFGRFVPGVRSVVALPAGTLHMSRVLYATLTLIGSLVWNAALIGIGWFFGEEWHLVSDAIGSASTPLLIVLVVGVTALVTWRSIHHRRRRDRDEGSAPERDGAAGPVRR